MLDFLILYEHKVRELDNICLLKSELEKRGYSVEFHQIDALKRLKFFLAKKPKVVLGTALANNKRINDYVYSTVGSIKKIVNLQLEQVISPKWESTNVFIPTGDGLKITHICWGKESYERLIKYGVRNAVICGAIQTDFFRNEFFDYYSEKEEIFTEFNLDDKKRTVLYISSFSPTTMTEEEYDYYEKLGGVKLDDLRNAFMESKVETISWIEIFLRQYPNIVFIYRPHPNEREDLKLKTLEEEYSNFRVISNLSVKQWIKIVDKVYTWISTSIVEAYFASVHCEIIRPIGVPEYIDIPFYKNSRQIRTLEDFLASANVDSNINPLNEEEIWHRYDYNYNKPSFKRICDLLEEVYNTKKYDLKPDIPLKVMIRNYGRVIIQEIIYRNDLLNPNKISGIPFSGIRKYLKWTNKDGNKHGNKEFLGNKEVENALNNSRKVVDRYFD